jgi:outer membrane lipoprotein-sorting protein
MQRLLVPTLAAFSILLVAQLASSAEGGAKKLSLEEILKRVDATLLNVDDQTYTGKVKVYRDDKVTKSMEFVVKMKGLRMKVVKFTAPGDVRGMSVLTTADNLMYVYLPSYKRVRRIAAHVRNQGFMGTDFSPEEMGAAAWSVGWNAKMIKETDKKWVLMMTPKKGTETTFSKRKLHVLKKYGGVSKIESFNADGKLVKTETRKDWKTFGPVTLPTSYTVQDHTTGSKSVMTFSGCKVNQGLPDSAFTKRALMRSGR